MCSASSPVTKNPTNPEPTRRRKTSTDREETGSDRAFRFAHKSMPPTRPRPITTIVSIEDVCDAQTAPTVDPRKRARFSRGMADALPGSRPEALTVAGSLQLTARAAPAMLNLVQHLVTLEVEDRGLADADAIAS